MEIAKGKTFYCPVNFIMADAFSCKACQGGYNASFAWLLQTENPSFDYFFMIFG
jgi:hypothetical protein